MGIRRAYRLVLLMCTALLLHAQTAAKITGTVRDQNGQLLGGATLRAVGQKTAVKRVLTAEQDGSFTLNELPPDTYEISATCARCNEASTIVEVGPGQARATQIDLNTESSSDVISLDTHAVTLDFMSAKLGANVSGTEIAALPVNGRTFSPLALTAPYVSYASDADFSDLRFAGQSAEQNRYLEDGTDASSVISTAPGFVPLDGYQFRLRNSLDSIDSLRIDSVAQGAEDGGATGAQIKLISRSGSDAWHGSLFDYFRNDALQARNFFDDAHKAELRMNQYGGSLGGDLKKDKLFFFGSFEQLRQNAGENIFEIVPSRLARSFDNPAILPVTQAIPLGYTSTGDPMLDKALRRGVVSQNEWSGNARIDYLPSDKQRIFVRYSLSAATSIGPGDTTTPRDIDAKSSPGQAVASWSYQINSKLVEQLTFGFNHVPTEVNATSGSASLNGTRVIVEGTGTSEWASPGNVVQLADGSYGSSADYHGQSFSVNNTVDWVNGAHSIQAGVETRLIRIPFSRVGGTLYSARDGQSLGMDSDIDVRYFGDLSGRIAEQEQYAAFVQDQWRLNNQTLLVAGVRYDYFGATSEAHNRATLLDYSNFSSHPANGGFYPVSKLGFEPKLALTWSPEHSGGNTVFRVGSGIYEGPPAMLDTLWPIENATSRLLLQNASFPVTHAAFFNGSQNVLSNPLALDVSSFGKAQRNYLATASIQQALPAKFVLQTGYTGILSRQLTQAGFANLSSGVDPLTGNPVRPNAAFPAIPFLSSGGNSSYNGLQVALDRHLVDNLTATMSYNYAHSIGDSNGSGDEEFAQDPRCFRCDYGNNSFDVRQSVSANFVYEVSPALTQRYFGSGWLSTIVSGWSIAGLWNARTGLPLNVEVTRSNEIYYSAAGQYYSRAAFGVPADAVFALNAPYGLEDIGSYRPDLVAGVNPYLRNSSGLWLNPSAFSVPTPGVFGDLGRNVLRGPGFTQADAQLSRRFSFSESRRIEVRAEVFNLFNHPNFSNPPFELPSASGATFTSVSAPGFGVLNSTVSRTVGLGTSRQIQLSARFEF